MSINDKITILLTLKGRPLHTLRWLWHADRTHFPFRIFIADGGDDEPLAQALSSAQNFPNLDYVYRRYNDINLTAFWFKVVDSLERIDTPYVMMVDNDDFVIPSGVLKLSEILDENPSFVWAGSNTPSFSIDDCPGHWKTVLGLPRTISDYPEYRDWPFENPDPKIRVEAFFQNPYAIHYNLHRTEILLKLHKYIMISDHKNHDIIDWYKGIHSIVIGQSTHKNRFMSYIRQVGTSSVHSSTVQYDTAHRIYYSDWLREYMEDMQHLTALLGEVTGEEVQSLKGWVDGLALPKLRKSLVPRDVDIRKKETLFLRIRRAISNLNFARRVWYKIGRHVLFYNYFSRENDQSFIVDQKKDLHDVEVSLRGDGFELFVKKICPFYAP